MWTQRRLFSWPSLQRHATSHCSLGGSDGPIAEKRPHHVPFGAVPGQNRGSNPFPVPRMREDPWFWLRDDDRKNADVLAHLKKENEYAAQKTAHLEGLRDALFEEHKSHLKETDDQPPYLSGGFFYYTRTVQGLSYKIHCRRPAVPGAHVPDPGSQEEVLLDENKVAEGTSHCDIRSVKPSPDHKFLAYAVDFSGNEVYQVRVLDISSGDFIPGPVADMAGNLAWGDSATLFYLTQDETLRPYRAWRHSLGTAAAEDELLLEEPDGQFYMGLSKSLSGRFIYVSACSGETYEMHSLDLASKDKSSLCVIQPRKFGLRYSVEHDGRDGLYIWTNKDGAINNRLMHAPIASCSSDKWIEAIPYDPSRMIEDVSVFKDFVVLEGRQGGLTRLWIMDVDANTGRVAPSSLRQVDFKEELYEVSTSINRVFNTPFLRIDYSSLTTPTQWIDLDMRSGASPRDILVKEQEVPNFDRTQYVCRRVFATAPDKTQIPMSIVHRRDLYGDAGCVGATPPTPKPVHLYGYGSYGICIDPHFSRFVLPYLDRGMIYVIAHVRGGGEMGRFWYEEEGKYLTKRNTFSDFIACAEHLVDNGFTTPDIMSCEGRSAGGMLVGNVVNMRPDLFKAVIAGVPFVDIMNTMCDPTIPLTTNEWEEWGNPNEPKYFDYMLSYSPVDNVREQEYPNILITAGLHDPRVPYWEPAKWATKLRAHKTDNGVIIAKFDLDSGHFSASDRYRYMREKAYDQAFVLNQLGVEKP